MRRGTTAFLLVLYFSSDSMMQSSPQNGYPPSSPGKELCFGKEICVQEA